MMNMEIPDIYKVDEIKNYDLVYLGLYTWRENFQNERWGGKHFSLFGSGDRSYGYFCGALGRLKEILTNCGAIFVAEPLRIEMAPDKEEEEEISKYVQKTLLEAKTSNKV